MFKIGEFSRFARVSIKMLRHYDRIGLLEPAHTDPSNGYRYYSVEQLPRLNRIIALKDMGFKLEQIGDLLEKDLSAEELRGLLKMKHAEIEREMREQQARLLMVEARLSEIEAEDALLPYDVVVRRVEAQQVASIRRTVPIISDDIAEMFDAVEVYVTDKRARAPRPPILIYYDEEYVEDEIDIEVAVPLSQRIPASGEIGIRTLPAVPQMATLIYTGRYEQMQSALTHLYRWIESNGYRTAGPPRDVYLRYSAGGLRLENVDGFLTGDSAQYVTEFQVPITQ